MGNPGGKGYLFFYHISKAMVSVTPGRLAAAKASANGDPVND